MCHSFEPYVFFPLVILSHFITNITVVFFFFNMSRCPSLGGMKRWKYPVLKYISLNRSRHLHYCYYYFFFLSFCVFLWSIFSPSSYLFLFKIHLRFMYIHSDSYLIHCFLTAYIRIAKKNHSLSKLRFRDIKFSKIVLH